MSHHIYTTDAIILNSYIRGESDKVFKIFTKELGLIIVHAKSVREEKSKMRFSLQDLSLCRVSLVKGKVFWRLTGVLHKYNFFQDVSYEGRIIAERIVELLNRFIPEEEKNEELFAVLALGFSALATNKDTVSNTELLFVARILWVLGYFPKKELYKDIFSEGVYDVLVEDELKIGILGDINKAISESHF